MTTTLFSRRYVIEIVCFATFNIKPEAKPLIKKKSKRYNCEIGIRHY